MSEPGNIIRTAARKRAVAKARPHGAPATARPVERSGRTLSADTIAKLKLMLGHLDASRNICQGMLDEHQAMLDANESGEKFAELMKQWAHALH